MPAFYCIPLFIMSLLSQHAPPPKAQVGTVRAPLVAVPRRKADWLQSLSKRRARESHARSSLRIFLHQHAAGHLVIRAMRYCFALSPAELELELVGLGKPSDCLPKELMDP